MADKILQIFIKDSIEGTSFLIQLNEDISVGRLNREIRNKIGKSCSMSDFQLKYQGRILEDEDTIENCGIVSMSTLEMFYSLPGGSDWRIKWLSSQPLKTIGKVAGCPSVRGCPGCGNFIEHNEACKHMTCWSCGTNFCFVCLQRPNTQGQWPCGSHADVCPVAPHQTYLPNPP